MFDQDLASTSCPFCLEQVKKRIVFETREVIVILSRDAIAPGHCLVISKRHVGLITELTNVEARRMFLLAQSVARILVNEFEYEGVNIFVNCGEAAGQTVFHAHIHVLPRRNGDVLVARDWLNPEFRKREYQPDSSELIHCTRIISRSLKKIGYIS